MRTVTSESEPAISVAMLLGLHLINDSAADDRDQWSDKEQTNENNQQILYDSHVNLSVSE
jgi:hypothetical protein